MLHNTLLLCFFAAFILSGCYVGEEARYSDIDLEVDKVGDQLVYYKSGESYTGKQTYRYSKTDNLFSEAEFENGLRTKTIGYERDGSGIRWHHEYEYIDGELAKTVTFFPDGQKNMEVIYANTTDDGIGITRYWHPNGQLNFEMSWIEDHKYHGLMTKWDEEGNILEQENYENGEPVDL